jgi:hypothetical protein
MLPSHFDSSILNTAKAISTDILKPVGEPGYFVAS